MKALKVILHIVAGFIVPIESPVEPDGTKFRCTLRGVKSSLGNFEPWKEVFKDFIVYIERRN